MAIQVMQNYLSVDEYARLCGVKRRVIMDRIKAGGVSATKIDGYYTINVVANPPRKYIHRSQKKANGGTHVAHKELRCVVTWCRGKSIRSYPYLRAIILGKIDGWVFGEEVFAKADDLEQMRKSRK